MVDTQTRMLGGRPLSAASLDRDDGTINSKVTEYTAQHIPTLDALAMSIANGPGDPNLDHFPRLLPLWTLALAQKAFEEESWPKLVNSTAIVCHVLGMPEQRNGVAIYHKVHNTLWLLFSYTRSNSDAALAISNKPLPEGTNSGAYSRYLALSDDIHSVLDFYKSTLIYPAKLVSAGISFGGCVACIVPIYSTLKFAHTYSYLAPLPFTEHAVRSYSLEHLLGSHLHYVVREDVVSTPLFRLPYQYVVTPNTASIKTSKIPLAILEYWRWLKYNTGKCVKSDCGAIQRVTSYHDVEKALPQVFKDCVSTLQTSVLCILDASPPTRPRGST